MKERKPGVNLPKKFSGAAARITRNASLHYQGQTFELTIPVPWPIDRSLVNEMEEAFGREHERTWASCRPG